MVADLISKIKSFLNGEYSDIPKDLVNELNRKIFVAVVFAVCLIFSAFFLPTTISAIVLIFAILFTVDAWMYSNAVLGRHYIYISQGKVIAAERSNAVRAVNNFIHSQRSIYFVDILTEKTYALTIRKKAKLDVGVLLSGYFCESFIDSNGVHVLSRALSWKPIGLDEEEIQN